MSIKFKVLLLSIIGPTLLAITIFFNAVQNIWTSEEQAVIHSAKGIVSMAESARNEMAMKFDGVIRPFGEIPRDKLIDAVPIITAIKMARQNAEKLGYKFRVPKFSPRNPANEPNALEKTALEQITSKGLPELIVRQKDAIHYFKPIVLTAECMKEVNLMSSPLINITIPVFNRFHLTQKTIIALHKTAKNIPFVVTVVDNGSEQCLRNRLIEFKESGLIDNLFLLPRNMGISCACNIGWRAVDAPYYIKLDNDMITTSGDLTVPWDG